MWATCNFTKKTKFPLFPPNSMLERLSPSGGGGGLINKKTIKLSKFDKVLDIISKVAGGCFLSLIKIADNMNKKTAFIWIKIPRRLFLILISDLAETLQRTVLTE